MGLESHQNMNLVLSTDAKPRLKWTPELHQRFTEAVNQLGGPDKATPKTLMRVMGIQGLTLYHLKSHLQKYRLGKSQQLQTGCASKQEVSSDGDYPEIQSADVCLISTQSSEGNPNPINESFKIAQALQVQMEVERKLHEQIEVGLKQESGSSEPYRNLDQTKLMLFETKIQVQRHLQMRIEAQGKYLQSVLKKAQEMLSGYNCSAANVEHTKAELSRLVSMVNASCGSSWISELTEIAGSPFRDRDEKRFRNAVSSMESCLTSAEISARKEETLQKNEIGDPIKSNTTTLELSLMDVHSQDIYNNSGSNISGRKRNCSTISDGVCVELPPTRRLRNGDQINETGLLVNLDLNVQCQHDLGPSSKAIDLNCKGIDHQNDNF